MTKKITRQVERLAHRWRQRTNDDVCVTHIVGMGFVAYGLEEYNASLHLVASTARKLNSKLLKAWKGGA